MIRTDKNCYIKLNRTHFDSSSKAAVSGLLPG